LLLVPLSPRRKSTPPNLVIPQKKRPWLAAGEVIFINWAINRFNKWTRGEEGAFACVTWESWKDNIETGFVWDWNSFGTNFFTHPYHGSTYFNSARSLGMTIESRPHMRNLEDSPELWFILQNQVFTKVRGGFRFA